MSEGRRTPQLLPLSPPNPSYPLEEHFLNPPPPLLAIDQPNPPNVVISQNVYNPATGHQMAAQNVSSSSVTTSPPSCHSADFMLNTRQIITASRLDPDLLTSCANKDIDDVDLDRMYMEALMEDLKSSVGR